MKSEEKLNPNNLKMFISFNSADDKEAEKIHDFFINCGVDCFLSKEDIDVSENYKVRTYNEIYNADIFIYLLSENSKASDWCDQEMGMAYMKYRLGKSMIYLVLSDGTKPYGFISKFNAENIDNTNCLFNFARKIDEDFNSTLFDNIKKYYDSLIDLKIKNLAMARSFKEAEYALKFINHRSELLDENQLKRICEAAVRNDQIYDGFICKGPLEELLYNHKEMIDDDMFHEVLNKIN